MKTLRKELHLAALPQPNPNPHISERLQQDAPTLHALRTLVHLEKWFHVRTPLPPPQEISSVYPNI